MAALAVGYILTFFSEFLFVNVETVTWRLLPDMAVMTLVYGLVAYIFLAILVRYRVRNIWALFLAGAAYGWLLEGVVVQTMYEAFPFYVPFTGLSWHALIDVLVGFYLVRRALHAASPRRITQLAVGLGLFWGFWAMWMWQEGGLLSRGEFVALAFVTSAPLPLAYRVLSWAEPFQPHRLELRVLAGLALLLFALVVVMIPLALAVLPPLLALIGLALRRHRDSAAPARVRLVYAEPPRAAHLWRLGLMPVTAALTYLLYAALGLRIETNVIVYLATVPLSVGMYVWAVIRLRREPRPAPAASG